MEDYISKLTSYLSSLKPIEIDTLTINDDESPLGTEAKEGAVGEGPELKDGDDLTVQSGRLIGGPEPKNPTYINPKEVIDNRTPGVIEESSFVWDKVKGCYVKRRRK